MILCGLKKSSTDLLAFKTSIMIGGHMILTYLILFVLAHKADTEDRHRGLSAASFATCPQFDPKAFCSPCLVDPCLDFSFCVSIFCHFSSQVCELCYVSYVLFFEFDWVCCLTVVSHCFGFVFVYMKSNFRCVSYLFFSFALYVSVAMCKQRYVICKVYVS